MASATSARPVTWRSLRRMGISTSIAFPPVPLAAAPSMPTSACRGNTQCRHCRKYPYRVQKRLLPAICDILRGIAGENGSAYGLERPPQSAERRVIACPMQLPGRVAFCKYIFIEKTLRGRGTGLKETAQAPGSAIAQTSLSPRSGKRRAVRREIRPRSHPLAACKQICVVL